MSTAEYRNNVMDEAMLASHKLIEEEVVHTMLVQWEGRENLKKLTAFKVLLGERDYQDKMHKDKNQEPLDIAGELLLLHQYVQKAMDTYANTFGDPQELPTLDVIRKISRRRLLSLERWSLPVD